MSVLWYKTLIKEDNEWYEEKKKSKNKKSESTEDKLPF